MQVREGRGGEGIKREKVVGKKKEEGEERQGKEREGEAKIDTWHWAQWFIFFLFLCCCFRCFAWL